MASATPRRGGGLGHKAKMFMQKKTKKDRNDVEDPEYNSVEDQFQKHVSTAMSLRKVLLQYQDSVEQLGTSTADVGSELNTYYNSNTHDVPRAVSLVGQMCADADSSIRSELSNIKHVGEEWEQYCGFLLSLSKKIAERTTLLDEFNYYREKVTGMRQKPPKDPEALPKNEGKLSDAEMAYKKINEELLQVFKMVTDDAVNAFGPLLSMMAKSSMTMFTDTHKAIQPLAPVIQTPEEYGCSISTPKYKGLIGQYGAETFDKEPKSSKIMSAMPSRPSAIGSMIKRGSSVAPPGGVEKRKSSTKGSLASGPTPVPAHLEYDATASPPAEVYNMPVPEPEQLGDLLGEDMAPAPTPPLSGSALELEAPVAEAPMPPSDAFAGMGVSDAPAPPVPAPAGDGKKMATALFDFQAEADDELGIIAGESLEVIEEVEEGWWKVQNSSGKSGIVPHNYIERH